jgi:hypothetical protein
MSDKDDFPAIREATGAYIESLLKVLLPAIRNVARQKGYAIAVHGSLKRDIDLVAIPWAHPNNTATQEELVAAVCGAASGVLGACNAHSKPSDKPHGRKAWTLSHRGFIADIDLSVVAPHPPEKGE